MDQTFDFGDDSNVSFNVAHKTKKKSRAIVSSDEEDQDTIEHDRTVHDSFEDEDQLEINSYTSSDKSGSSGTYEVETQASLSSNAISGKHQILRTFKEIIISSDEDQDEVEHDAIVYDSFDEHEDHSSSLSNISIVHESNGVKLTDEEYKLNTNAENMNENEAIVHDLFDEDEDEVSSLSKMSAGVHESNGVKLADEEYKLNTNAENISKPVVTSIQMFVKKSEHDEQVRKIANIEMELVRAQNARRIIKLENLPDKGQSLILKEKSLEKMLQHQREKLSEMVVLNEEPIKNKIKVKWEEIEAGVDAVGPRTLGKKGVARFNAEKIMAIETLDELHKSLATCPTENDLVENPRGLKVPLMTHQKRALAWLLWRENEKPSGGLLADDMGLGKTLTMISLVIKSLELEANLEQDKEKLRDRYPGGTLVVCPASLLNQWSGEIEKRTKRGLLSVEVHHGAKREVKAKRLARHDIVITTYAIVLSESEKTGTVFGVRWRRIILDEAHQIRNYKSRTSEAIYNLSGKSRWALTGTPVHNKELDMYSLLKFLRCAPFDDLKVWKHWVGDKSTGGQARLHAVISSLMLRRTKDELMEAGVLPNLPERTWQMISITLDKDETAVYQKVLIFSRTLFAQFLHQKAEKNQDVYDLKFNSAPPDPNGEYFKMRNKLLKLNRVKNVSQHEILVLLLRLRQICCHPSLITQMLDGDEDLGNADDEEESEELNLLEQLNKLNINDEEDVAQGLSSETVALKEASKGYLNASNPVFMEERASSKVKALVQLLKEKISTGDKAIIVSQWRTFLQLVAIQLKEARIIYDSLDGSIPVNKRMPIVDKLNDPNSDVKVLLLSLTAGGVGLNLIGANHLFLMDLHWNPQLENQAQDRIYRMGQNKPIFVYKLMAVETIEERIQHLQEKKLDIANSMLTGSKKIISSKLTLQDLKLLFDFK